MAYLILSYLKAYLSSEMSVHSTTVSTLYTLYLHKTPTYFNVYQVQTGSLFTADVIVNQTLYTVTKWQCDILQGFINFLT